MSVSHALTPIDVQVAQLLQFSLFPASNVSRQVSHAMSKWGLSMGASSVR